MLIAILMLLSSCVKEEVTNSRGNIVVNPDPDPVDCSKIVDLKINPFTSVTVGEEIYISADPFEGARYDWDGPNNYDQNNIDEEVWITYDANIYHRGWYHVSIYNDTCPPINDSVYVDVKLPQGSPSCTVAENTTTFTIGIQPQTYTNVFSSSSFGYEIKGGNDKGTLLLRFNEYWNTNELEEGIYYTSSDLFGDVSDKETINKVYVQNGYINDRWIAEPNNPVYVSKVGGKIRITFCDIPTKAVSSGGQVFTSDMSGQLSLP